jgi:hypothetical protein
MAVDKQEIEKLLREYFRVDGSYSISETGLVSVIGDAKSQKKCKKLPVSFDHVRGYFDCSNMKLTALVGAPKWVGAGFYCGDNRLTSLVGAPQWVGGDFYCVGNQLTSLEGAPRYVGRTFVCSGNQLKTLEGAPQWVGTGFGCSGNQLTSLEGAPRWIGHGFGCSDNPLESLKGIPLHIGSDLSFTYDKKLPLCEILISRIKNIYIYDEPPELLTIIKKYLNTGYQGIPPFANELIRAGYRDNAWM